MRQYLMKSGENVGERPTLLAVSGSTGVAWTTIRVRWCSEERLVGAVGWRGSDGFSQCDGILVCVVCVPSRYQRICLRTVMNLGGICHD